MSLRSPLGQVLGRGAAKEGVHHWWVQRLTAVALVPLAIWFVVSLLSLPTLSYPVVSAWMGQAWTAVLLILFVLSAAWHSQLGVRVVVEDYVHGRGMRTVALALVTYLHVLAAAAGVFAVIKVALGGAA
ncbi:MAG: succinate dehydrogenase, hydrophobic membrane anchor protein [Gammaproteobacteria bacterium]|jgi:succinate dehydrogenase / fumarate reductase membrane anchor subunit|nr:succinate dehydrogenase, hydrophobic membrane anchor protein [Gammaproteobacteria bacterium]